MKVTYADNEHVVGKLERVLWVNEDSGVCVRAYSLLCMIQADESRTIDDFELTMAFAVTCCHVLNLDLCGQYRLKENSNLSCSVHQLADSAKLRFNKLIGEPRLADVRCADDRDPQRSCILFFDAWH